MAGHRGMVGGAIVRDLQSQGHSEFVLRTHPELDLTNQAAVNAFLVQEKPDQVYLAAAKVGGIHANNTYPADFIYLAHAVGQTVGYQGTIKFDSNKPDGAPRKWMDSSRLGKLGWQANVDLIRGLVITYQDFLERTLTP